MAGDSEAQAHSTNYFSTFITVAPDSPAPGPQVPPQREPASIAQATYDLIAANPYALTSDDVIFTVWATRQGIAEADLPSARAEFFSTGRPCLRSSDLTKRYGWGIHSDESGRVAIYGKGSDEYDLLALGMDYRDRSAVKVISAMRTSRT